MTFFTGRDGTDGHTHGIWTDRLFSENSDNDQIIPLCPWYTASYNSADAQNLVFTSGYSQMEHSFILDLEAGSLSEAGQQEVEPNLTFMDISGKSFQYS